MDVCVPAKSLQSCPTLFDSMDYSPPGSSVHGILQPRILEWIARPSSRGSSRHRDRPAFPAAPALQENSLPLSHQGSPRAWIVTHKKLALVVIFWEESRMIKDRGKERFFLIKVQLICNAVLVSGIQHSASVVYIYTCIFFFKLFSTIGH